MKSPPCSLKKGLRHSQAARNETEHGEKSIRVLNSIIFSLIIGLPFACTAIAQALLQVGAKAPDFSLKDIDGKVHTLSEYSEKKALVIVFWSTWSAKSPKALRRFEEFHKKYKDKGIQVIGINRKTRRFRRKTLRMQAARSRIWISPSPSSLIRG